MAIRDIFKISRKTFFNPSGWIDFDSLRDQNLTIWTALKSLFTTPTAEYEETFEEAMERLGLTEKDIKTGATVYRTYALIFVSLGFLLFCYGFFLLFRYETFLDWLLSISASGLFFAQAFKYDFWSYQMRERRLGVTFNEWRDSVLGKGKPK